MSLNLIITLAGAVILMCIVLNRISSRIGIPTLLFFISLGIFFTHPSFLAIPFSDFAVSEKICTVALIFIMFYGGFGTRWEEAKQVAAESIILASLGVILTAFTVAAFCHFILGMSFPISFLLGSVISSTDAASVFSIIRSKKLSLRFNTSSLLELESGSNDPFSYMLTITALTIMTTGTSATETALGFIIQIGVAVISGLTVAMLAILLTSKFDFPKGWDTVFVFAVALLSYSVPSLLGGNGYLSAYIVGIILGNSAIANKKELVHFFDGVTELVQMLLFFLLGLLSDPYKVVANLPTAFAVFLFLTFIGRPLVVEVILRFFKTTWKQRVVVASAGLRGAASIVFAIMATNHEAETGRDIFSITFGIVLLSILLQGTLLPVIAKKLDMTDPTEDPLKSFTDYSEEKPIEFISFFIDENHPWGGRKIKDIYISSDLLLVLILRQGMRIIPDGESEIQAGDRLVCIAKTFTQATGIELNETVIDENSHLVGKPLSEMEEESLVLLIKRNEEYIIPTGSDVFEKNDEVVYIRKDLPLSEEV